MVKNVESTVAVSSTHLDVYTGQVYMVSQNMGQVPGIDFGPGQYYYTDIPGWQKYFLVNAYDNHVPLAVLIGLFFAWGYLMYRFWCFLDRRWKD